jgi:3-methyladenine DNA glycosylase/8-oxoguanine DNA glycosylase
VVVLRVREDTVPADVECELAVPAGYHLGRSLSGLRMGSGDPCMALEAGRVRWALYTPAGPATLEAVQGAGGLRLRAWGDGAEWLGAHAAGPLGLLDPAEEFAPESEPVRRLWRRFRGTRLPRLPVVLPRAVQVVLLQLVTTQDGHGSWRRLVRGLGEAAPGPFDLLLPPSAARLRTTAEYVFPSFGVLPRQARTVLRLAREAPWLERAAAEGPEALRRRLETIPGVGEWTIQYVLGSALADTDAVLVGDYNLPHAVGFVLAGEERASEERMLELLEPYRGHRYRVIRLLWMNGVHAPRRGPRMPRRVL